MWLYYSIICKKLKIFTTFFFEVHSNFGQAVSQMKKNEIIDMTVLNVSSG